MPLGLYQFKAVFSEFNAYVLNFSPYFRMARMEAAVFVGLLLGAICSGRLYQMTSASLVFGLSTLCTVSGLILVFFFVKESIKNETEETSRVVSHSFLRASSFESIK